MGTTILLAVVSTVAHFDPILANSCLKGVFSGHHGGEQGVEMITSDKMRNQKIQYNFSASMETLTKELRSSQEEQKQTNQKFKDVESGARRKRQVLKDNLGRNSTWRDGVFYTFNTSDHIVQKVFKMGAEVWRENTCIDFVESKNAKDKLVVFKRNGSFSHVGRMGGDQFFALNDKATVGIAVHEIGHILGFFHTISRYDRDSYIRIVVRNIDPLNYKNFGKVSKNLTDVFGLTYDYGSVMHYGELSGSINNQPTLIALDPFHQKTMGSDLISFSDIFAINEHYGCNARCNKSTSAKCENEGFPHPRNCSICICPSGYGGELCDRRPPGCGEDLVATKEKQTVECSVGSGPDLRDHFDFCNYMITAPEGKKIEVELLSIPRGYQLTGCKAGGIEIKAQKDQKMTGYRFCSADGNGSPVVSHSNRLPLILYNRIRSMHANFTFRYID